MTIERGEPEEYEVVWCNGHVDHFKAHQVTYLGGPFSFGAADAPRRVHFHGEFDGKWVLVLSAPEDDILVIRNVTRASGEIV